MRKYAKKIGMIGCIAIVTVFAGAWYTIPASNIKENLENVGDRTNTLCVMAENRALFDETILETDELQRCQAEQNDEQDRRTAKVKIRRSPYQKVLERIVEAEAGDQDLRGRILVANVILNRVKSKEFPNTIKEVVFSPRQFSPVSEASYYSVHVSSLTKKAVQTAVNGVDYSRGALYFMCRSASSSSNVAWFDRDLKYLFSHGCHEFFC